MEVRYEKPPMWDRAVNELGANNRTVFTYGKTVYVPSGDPLNEELKVHETIHSIQQGDLPDKWWERYFSDSIFRVEQEVEAYRAQYKFYSATHKDRNDRARYARSLAGTLAGTLYGRPVDFNTAYKQITGH